jgi:eukaryotic-like serine/threonine-protein kinase
MMAAYSKYWAFISYSHHDKRVAKWLRRSLKGMRIPKKSREAVAGRAPKFDRIYLDEEEASAANQLSGHLREALDSSLNLIVICSPFAVASKTVEAEIAHFIARNGRDRVICIVASGIPNAADRGESHLECFPRPLRFMVGDDGAVSDRPIPIADRPLAAPLGEETKAEKKTVLRRVTAGLLGVTVREYAGYQRFWAFGGWAVAAVVLIGLAAGWDLQLRTHTEYYEDYVRRWGIWEGVNPVKPETARARNSTYKFIRAGRLNPPLEVSLINGMGHFAEGNGIIDVLDRDLTRNCSSSRASKAVFKYDSQGRVLEEALQDPRGNVLQRMRYATGEVAEFKEAGFGCKRTKSGVQYIQFHRASDSPQAGLDTRILFLSDNREPRTNPNGIYGIDYSYNKTGQVITKSFINPDASLRLSNHLIAKEIREYNSDGRIEYKRFLDPTGTPTSNSDGYAVIKYTYDDRGNTQITEYLNADGEGVLTKDGYAKRSDTFDERGNIVQTDYFDSDNQKVLSKDGVARVIFEFDERGYNVARRYFDRGGEPTLRVAGEYVDGGCHYETYPRNEFAETISWRCFGVNDEPALFQGPEGGFHEQRLEHDEFGNRIATEVFDTKGEPALGKFGIFRAENLYDDFGRRTGSVFFGIDREPIFNAGGFHSFARILDEAGNQLEGTTHDINGQLMALPSGYALLRTRYDEYGNAVEYRYFDENENPTYNLTPTNVVPMIRVEYDPYARIEKVSFHNLDGTPAYSDNGISGFKNTFDSRGNRIALGYFGLEQEPILNKDGWAGWRRYFDARDNVVRFEYLGLSGETAVSDQAPTVYLYGFDEKGRRISVRFADHTGKIIPSRRADGTPHEYAGWETTYDDRGNISVTTYVDASDKPVPSDDNIAIVKYYYNEKDKEIRREFFDSKGYPTNIFEDGASAGYAASTSEYDDRGNIVMTSLFGIDGQPAVHFHDHYSINKRTYDHNGKLLSSSFYDANEQPVATRGGVFEFRYVRDRFGREAEGRFYGIDHKLILHRESQRAIVRTEFDSRGRVSKESSFGVDEEPVNRADEGWSWKTMGYDVRGQVAVTRYYDKAGVLLKEESP